MRWLDELLDSTAFDAMQEMAVNLRRKLRYHDVTVCVGRIPNEVRTFRDALAAFEVLSLDTVAIDRHDKLED